MNKTIVALAFVLTSSVALAQTPTSGNPDSDTNAGHKPARAERMQNDLGLTQEQVKKMREIRDNGGSREEMQAVLTPEQRTKAIALRKEHRDDRDERKAQMQKELGLSSAQQAKLEQIRKDGGTREEMRAVLTPEQQAKFDDMRSKREGTGGKPGGKWGKPPAAKPADASTPPPAATSSGTPASE